MSSSKPIKIRKTQETDIPQVLSIYDKARAYMRATGNMNQWPQGYPSEESLLRDMSLSESYVCFVEESESPQTVQRGLQNDGDTDKEALKERIVGTFFFHIGLEPTYAKIYQGQWLNDLPYGVIHRAASDGSCRGVMRAILDYCFQEVGDIRIDTHGDNAPMQRALKEYGFDYCGIIYLANGDERLAFQLSRTDLSNSSCPTK